MSKAQYRLTDRLEGGALADLFRATRDGERVVIKLFQELSSDAAYARAIAGTSRALAPVQHPGIVRDLDLGVVRKRLAVVRPEVEGVTLGHALQKLNTREAVLPAAVALTWAIELLEVVQRAHEAGVVHGGITPGNVLLTPGGQLRLCDFGAMAALLATPALKKAMLGSGRSGYRAPEVHLGELPTPAADVYSVGALLYELLTLREPGGGRELAHGRAPGVQTRRDQLTPPSRIDRRLNARLDPIVMRALDFTASRRFRSAGEFGAALRNFLAESGGIPSAEDLRRCVAELSTPVAASSELPFSEPFTLVPIDGSELGGAGERTVVYDERPAYSGGRVKPNEFPEDAPTTEAAPAFEEYRPEATQHRGPRPETAPPFDDTDPGQAGPLEKGWEAPPGAAPRKKVNDRGERTVVRPPRVKVIEDFSVIEPAPELTATRSGKRHREPREPGSGREVSQAREAPVAREAAAPRLGPEREERSVSQARPSPLEPVPGDASPVAPRPMRTAERRMLEAMKRNQRFFLTISGLALLGAICFGAAIWKLNSRRNRPSDVQVAAAPAPRKEPAPPPPAPVPKANPVPAPVVTWDDPPPRRQAGFLSVRTNVAAYVYIDGARVRVHTPLKRYRVRPGRRKIVLEAIATGDRRDFTVSIARGKLRTIEEIDLQGPPR